MTERELLAKRGGFVLAVKMLNTEIDDFACGVCELLGGDAEIEGTEARREVFKWAKTLPRYNKAARAARLASAARWWD